MVAKVLVHLPVRDKKRETESCQIEERRKKERERRKVNLSLCISVSWCRWLLDAGTLGMILHLF